MGENPVSTASQIMAEARRVQDDTDASPDELLHAIVVEEQMQSFLQRQRDRLGGS